MFKWKKPFELGQEQNLAGWGVWREQHLTLFVHPAPRIGDLSDLPWSCGSKPNNSLGFYFVVLVWVGAKLISFRVAGMGLCLSCSVWKAGGKSRKGGHWEWCVCWWLMLAKKPCFQRNMWVGFCSPKSHTRHLLNVVCVWNKAVGRGWIQVNDAGVGSFMVFIHVHSSWGCSDGISGSMFSPEPMGCRIRKEGRLQGLERNM